MAAAEHAERLDLVVDAEHEGQRLDQYLAAVIPGRSRSQLQRLIRDEAVRLNGTAVRPSASVAAGDRVELLVPAVQPPSVAPEALDVTILYDDQDVVVIDKPAGMVVHPAAGHTAGTLVNALLHHVRDLSGVGGELRPGIVHRLDRGTSGLMVVAKHDAAHAELARQFHDREVEKEYLALVWGLVHAGRRIEAPIGRDPHHRQRMSTRARRARTAVTRVIQSEPLKRVTYARIGISTGRTHQIRVHLSSIGHPVVGDPLYGGVRKRPLPHLRAVGRLERPFLHAARLSFAHPRDGRRVEIESPLPSDLQDVLDELRAGTGAEGRD